jgi:hypothetical protein
MTRALPIIPIPQKPSDSSGLTDKVQIFQTFSHNLRGMTDAELIRFNERGLIPGPGELEEEFSFRAAEAGKKDRGIPENHWDWARARLKEIFDFEPRYVSAMYSNKGLAPWQGAASWIEGREIALVQMNERLKSGSLLGLYDRDEILAHEGVHAARSGFDEDGCEEFFAYLVSEKKWLRVLGPIVKRPWEVWPLLIGAALGLVSPWGTLAAALWTGLGFLRLIRQHRTLAKAGNRVFKSVQDRRRARAILFRLTDREIGQLARGMDLEEYAKKQGCLRWRLIRIAYLKGCPNG